MIVSISPGTACGVIRFPSIGDLVITGLNYNYSDTLKFYPVPRHGIKRVIMFHYIKSLK